jgi:Holliday junction resolvase RusA-like endonuclease
MVKLFYYKEPISVNKLYINVKGQSRKFLSKEGKEFKAYINKMTSEQLVGLDDLLRDWVEENQKLVVMVTVSSPTWLLKDRKTPRKKDISNIEKALLDSVFDAIKESGFDLDDCLIWSVTLLKQFSLESKIEVLISPYTGIMGVGCQN